MGFPIFDGRHKRGEANPDSYINQNDSIRTFYDPENQNYNEQDILNEKKEKMQENIMYGVIITICLIFFGAILFW